MTPAERQSLMGPDLLPDARKFTRKDELILEHRASVPEDLRLAYKRGIGAWRLMLQKHERMIGELGGPA